MYFKIFHSEADGVPDDLCNDWTTTKLPELVKDYAPEDIYNGDEFGLFWRLSPQKSFVIKGQKFKTGKKSKERVSVLICTNSLGTDKLKPIIIGRSREPRCFRGKKLSDLPIVYRNNTKSWMTSEIFKEFLANLNKSMKQKDRNIVLIVDNCKAHPKITLTNVKLVFLPANSTSRLQAMDLGVIHALKANYRQRLVRRLLAIYESKNIYNVKTLTYMKL